MRTQLVAMKMRFNRELKKMNSSFRWSVKVVGKINLTTKSSVSRKTRQQRPQMSAEAKQAMLARLKEARKVYEGVHHIIAALLRGEWVATNILRKYDNFLELLNLRKKCFRGGEDAKLGLFVRIKDIFGKAKDFLAELKAKGRIILGVQEATWTKYTNWIAQ